MKRGAAARELLRRYVADMPRELAALAAEVARLGRPELSPLDRSYASLDRIEDYFILVLDGQPPGSRKRARARVERYVGATLVEQAGGRWATAPDDADLIAVTGLRAAPDVVFLPANRVMDVETWRYPGLLRDRTERHDLELQRRTIAALTQDVHATLSRLRADVTELTGTDPGPLDGVPALSSYEAALRRVTEPTAPRELRRRIREGAAIGVGHLMQAELGPSTWRVEDAPRDIDFGAWCLYGRRLSNTVSRVNPTTSLRRVIEKMIENQRKKPRPTPAATEASRRRRARPAEARSGRVRLGKWMVLCSSRQALSVKDVLARVAMPSGAEVRLAGRVLVLTVAADEGREVELQVGLSRAKVVAAEAAEFAAEYGAGREDQDEIAAYDARYEITWDLTESEWAFDAYHTLACRLAKAVRGVVVDRIEGRFVDA